MLEHYPDRTFAFDELGPLAIKPTGGSAWAPKGKPQRQPANYHRLHGVRQFHACYSVGDDELWGVVRDGTQVHSQHTKALKSIRGVQRVLNQRGHSSVGERKPRVEQVTGLPCAIELAVV